MSIIKSVKGLFGQIIHYKDGVKIGETWDSFIPGIKNHYDANGSYVGHSAKGFIANEAHYNRYGSYEAASYDGAFGAVHHYGADGSHGVSTDGLFCTNTYLHDDSDKHIFDNPEFDSGFDSDFDAKDVGDSFDSDW